MIVTELFCGCYSFIPGECEGSISETEHDL
jgi:hypothetical protein